ncbi:MAG: metallophosphoesterase family protein [Clostridia bacterium]|nr:metallophosphoesterase family protein [Clostridia bacterium]
MPEERNPHTFSRKIGLWLSRLPAPKWLYPLYLPRQLYLKEYEVAAKRVPPALSGLRIAYASDMHYGGYLDEQRVSALAEKLNALHADIIILGGDYGENNENSLEFWRLIPDLHARLAVCAVMGNHDLKSGPAQPLLKEMRRRGVTPLVNKALRLTRNGVHFAVCATDDLYLGHPDFEKTARQASGQAYVIYAPHSPDALKFAYALSEKPFFDLAICGHTHGGQVALFGVGLATSSRQGFRYGNRYRTGMLRERGVHVIVSNGVGTTWLPLRLGVEPQYHLITLKHTEKEP